MNALMGESRGFRRAYEEVVRLDPSDQRKLDRALGIINRDGIVITEIVPVIFRFGESNVVINGSGKVLIFPRHIIELDEEELIAELGHESFHPNHERRRTFRDRHQNAIICIINAAAAITGVAFVTFIGHNRGLLNSAGNAMYDILKNSIIVNTALDVAAFSGTMLSFAGVIAIGGWLLGDKKEELDADLNSLRYASADKTISGLRKTHRMNWSYNFGLLTHPRLGARIRNIKKHAAEYENMGQEHED